MAWSCAQYQKWVQKEVREPIERQREGRREKCKKKKCKKWCLCCNKWFCWIETFFYYVVEWIVRIIGEWVFYVVCRIVTTAVVLGLLGVVLAGWIFKWGYCMIVDDVDKLPPNVLQVEVVVIHRDEETRNPITEDTIDTYIYHASLIFDADARVKVERRGKIRHEYSSALWRLDVSGGPEKVSEYLKGVPLLIGRESPRYLTVYAIGGIEGAEALHQPFYGSVFMVDGMPETSLAHEFGHATLAFWNAYHSSTKGALMFVPWTERERDSGWPDAAPTMSKLERCTVRRSRWLDFSWLPFYP